MIADDLEAMIGSFSRQMPLLSRGFGPWFWLIDQKRAVGNLHTLPLGFIKGPLPSNIKLIVPMQRTQRHTIQLSYPASQWSTE